jgi:hypothetical protein
MGAEGAWSNQLLNLLIIAASSSGFSGFFVYSPVPGHGNLVASFAAAAGTDLYGNAYPADLTIGLASKTQIQIASNGGVGVVKFLLNNAGFVNGLLESAVLGSFAQIVLNGPASTVAGHQDFVGFEMNSSDGVSSLANMQFIYTNTSGLVGHRVVERERVDAGRDVDRRADGHQRRDGQRNRPVQQRRAYQRDAVRRRGRPDHR